MNIGGISTNCLDVSPHRRFDDVDSALSQHADYLAVRQPNAIEKYGERSHSVSLGVPAYAGWVMSESPSATFAPSPGEQCERQGGVLYSFCDSLADPRLCRFAVWAVGSFKCAGLGVRQYNVNTHRVPLRTAPN